MISNLVMDGEGTSASRRLLGWVAGLAIGSVALTVLVAVSGLRPRQPEIVVPSY